MRRIVATGSRSTGIATSAVRFYEDQGLISSVRTTGNQRRYPRHVLRRISIILAARRFGITLAEVAEGRISPAVAAEQIAEMLR